MFSIISMLTFILLQSEACAEPSQISEMEFFAKIVNGFRLR